MSSYRKKLGLRRALPLVRQYTPRNKGGLAVDLGCGQGHNAVHMAEMGYIVDAIDGTVAGTMVDDMPEILTLAQQYARYYKLPLLTRRVTIENFLAECDSDRYDLIVCTYVLQFSDKDGQLLYFSIMPEIMRCLKPGGRLICTMLKSKKEKEHGYVEMIPRPLETRTDDLALQAVWEGKLKPIHYAVSHVEEGSRKHPSPYQYVSWELVGEKL